MTCKTTRTYILTEQVSLAKNGDFLRRIKELNVKVVVKK